MRVLFISRELGASELALKLKAEGCEVKLYIQDHAVSDCLEGMIPKVIDWKAELSWVGKEGLLIFDDIGFGEDQSLLREEGYRVVGGSMGGDLIETSRLIGKQVLESSGMQVLPAYNFSSLSQAKKFLIAHADSRWVVKVNNGHVSSLCYVGELRDQSDLLGILDLYDERGIKDVYLQQRAEGVEVGVGRYFNGNDWVGPIEMNVEHKSLMAGNVGPKTAEMGTLMWYDTDESNPLFIATLSRIKDYLSDIDFRGDVDINCIVNETGVWPLEFTARFGNPATALQIELHDSPWSEFLSAVADGKEFDLKFKKGFGITVTLAVPPYPYYFELDSAETSKGLPLAFTRPVAPEDLVHYGFEEVSSNNVGQLHIAGSRGCVAHISGHGKSVEIAREQAYDRVKNLIVPKAFYRTDIGLEFIEHDQNRLKQWGWLK